MFLPPGTIAKEGSFGTAVFSIEKPLPLYRYLLQPHDFAKEGPVVLFAMTNPSKANEDQSDRTVTRCIGFAKKLNAKGMVVVNMCALISTDPKGLLEAKDPVGPENLHFITNAVTKADIIIVGWGALSKKQRLFFQPSIDVFKGHSALKCLGKTQSGDPRHPLYLAAVTELEPWP